MKQHLIQQVRSVVFLKKYKGVNPSTTMLESVLTPVTIQLRSVICQVDRTISVKIVEIEPLNKMPNL